MDPPPRRAHLLHPLFGADLATLRRAFAEAGGGLDGPRAALVWGLAAAMAPFAALERAMGESRLPAPEDMAPVFILGHWRSGTTHLHNLLSRGPYGYPRPDTMLLPWTLQTLRPVLSPLIHGALPDDRFVDSMALTPDSPQEDELPVASMTTLSWFHAFYFPRDFRRRLRRGLFFEHAREAEIAGWERAFTLYLRKLARIEGRPLLLKNPALTARPARVRALCPRAKFIHIRRNPFGVFASTRRLWRRMLETLPLQRHEPVDVEGGVLETYREMMTRFDAETAGWDAPDLVEIAYEDLAADPASAVKRAHDRLGLPGWRRAAPAMAAYVAALGRHSPRPFEAGEADIARVAEAWAPWIERWGYATPRR